MKKIVITGGTGFLGSLLARKLADEGNQITVFTRHPERIKKSYPGIQYFRWDYTAPDLWKEELNKNEIIIHLAGTGLFTKRWSKSFKKEIMDSRAASAENIADAINSSDTSVKTFITASAIGYYGNTSDEGVNESGSAGADYLAEICKKWESAAWQANNKNIRVVAMRMGLILSVKEGYLNRLLPFYRFFVGGPLGSRLNYLSWVHPDDVVNSYLFVINNDNLNGPVNITAPFPVTAGEFASALGREMQRPSFFRVPAFLIRIVVGEGGRYVTYSQKVLPDKLLKCGFRFGYPELKTALKNILSEGK